MCNTLFRCYFKQFFTISLICDLDMLINDIIRLSISQWSPSLHLVSRSLNNQRSLFFSPRPTFFFFPFLFTLTYLRMYLLTPLLSARRTYLRNERRPLRSGGHRILYRPSLAITY